MFALKKTVTRANFGAAKRFAHTSYGPEEPLTPYLKWVAAVSAGIALVTYDRFYSDGAISRRVTPITDAAAQREETLKAVEEQWAAQERPIAFFDTVKRTTHLENFGANPVPLGGARADHSSDVLDIKDIGERRPRSQVH